jgi:spermidine/putrescine-binding protein
MVIAYKKSKFQNYKLAPIEDWADLWRPELAGRIAMVNSPREVVGAVLKYMRASYNTTDLDSQVPGGRLAVEKNLASLMKQVITSLLSLHTLKRTDEFRLTCFTQPL